MYFESSCKLSLLLEPPRPQESCLDLTPKIHHLRIYNLDQLPSPTPDKLIKLLTFKRKNLSGNHATNTFLRICPPEQICQSGPPPRSTRPSCWCRTNMLEECYTSYLGYVRRYGYSSVIGFESTLFWWMYGLSAKVRHVFYLICKHLFYCFWLQDLSTSLCMYTIIE